jgi:hypothetical protein
MNVVIGCFGGDATMVGRMQNQGDKWRKWRKVNIIDE